MSDPAPPPPRSRPPWMRFALAALLTILFGSAAYILADSSSPAEAGSVAIGLTFLLVFPAVTCALISFVTDREGTGSLGHYMALPAFTLAFVLLAGAIFFGEGVICILMLAPLWLIGGLVGSLLAYALRRRSRDGGRLFASGALLLPLFSAQIEAGMPVPVEWRTVAREVVVDAPPELVWPLLVSIPSIGAAEGRWTLSQNLFGVPRPTEALLRSEGGELVRAARWGPDIRFEERILRIEPGRSIDWAFAFPDDSVRRHTDRHVAPDGEQLRIASGRYSLVPESGGRTRVRLETRYRLQTPLNFYAGWWGELLLGDIQANVLAIIEQRAEAPL